MKEIKFRAWHLKHKKMVNREIFDRNWYTEENKVYAPIHPDDRYDYKLMQYTGLKDKNGVEIYDGDIVKTPEKYNLGKYNGPACKQIVGEVGYIYFAGCGFVWRHKTFIKEEQNQVNYIHQGFGLIDNYDLWNFQGSLEVIGNIHENPELLK